MMTESAESTHGLLMTSPEDFIPYTRLADELIEKATKEQPADVVRLLALNIGWNHQRYGDVPQEDLLRIVPAEPLNEQREHPLNAEPGVGTWRGVGD